MSIFVFLGPSLSHAEARAVLDAVYLAPARAGDVYRVAKLQPQAIVIIDGYFDRVPTVWHKEILWALSEGYPVFGGASMGALRALELQPFGMRGVGRIFADFEAGLLEDDDEVAVAHTRAEEGFRPVSVAMVDIRATLQEAIHQQILSPEQAQQLRTYAKSLFYPERTYTALAQEAARRGFGEYATWQRWFATHHIPQKRLDALATLQAVNDFLAQAQDPQPASYRFQQTETWLRLQQYAGQVRVQAGQYEHLRRDWILDELRLNQATYHRFMRLTLLQLAAQHIITQERTQQPATNAQAPADDGRKFLAQQGIPPQLTAQWLATNDLTPTDLQALVQTYASVDYLTTRWKTRIADALPGTLKLSGLYPQMAARALAKQTRLQQHYMEQPDLSDLGLTTQTLYEWFFIQQQRMPAIPPDLEQYARLSGFHDQQDFKRAILREYCFATLQADPHEAE